MFSISRNQSNQSMLDLEPSRASVCLSGPPTNPPPPLPLLDIHTKIPCTDCFLRPLLGVKNHSIVSGLTSDQPLRRTGSREGWIYVGKLSYRKLASLEQAGPQQRPPQKQTNRKTEGNRSKQEFLPSVVRSPRKLFARGARCVCSLSLLSLLLPAIDSRLSLLSLVLFLS